VWTVNNGAKTANFTTAQASAFLTSGNTVESGGNVYRYIGADQEINLGAIIFINNPSWQQISSQVGGTPVTYVDFTASVNPGFASVTTNQTVQASNGDVYKYIFTAGKSGSATTTINLSTGAQIVNGSTVSGTSFADQSIWQLLPSNVVGVVVNFTESQGTVSLATGVNVQAANGIIYQYLGQAGSVDLTNTDFTNAQPVRLELLVLHGPGDGILHALQSLHRGHAAARHL
jgi:hypothetical protein